MKVTVQGFIVAKQYEWEDAPSFYWLRFDPTSCDKDCAIVGPHEIEFDLPDDFDFRPFRIATLEREKEAIRTKLAAELTSIDDAIQKLLALPGVKEVQS
jgi:hypothetical protein